MLGLQQKLQDMVKGKKKLLSEEAKQSSESDSSMTHILKLSDREFKITMINMLSSLMEKLDNKQKKMGNTGRELKTLRNK